MRKTLIRIAGAAREFFFPNRCLACGELYRGEPAPRPGNPLPTDFGPLTADYLCTACRAGYNPVQSPLCSMCGLSFKSREGEDHLCQDCAMTPKHFRRARACGHYSGPLMNAIHRLKYGGNIQLAGPLGRLLYATFTDHFRSGDIDWVLPVPLHDSKFRKRGFNQSFLLIREWPRFTGEAAPAARPFRIARDILVRIKPTSPQTGLGRADRSANIRNAFRVTAPERISGRRILLVDDVYTTGATVNECAGVLVKHHAEQVDVLTLARAMPESVRPENPDLQSGK
ncbi:MAG: ComF family protein [Thermodesulfobacteriota bacterium]